MRGVVKIVVVVLVVLLVGGLGATFVSRLRNAAHLMVSSDNYFSLSATTRTPDPSSAAR
jgi:hypothetical protein